jgi:16S rRNA (adenine1518-N6/adenine1519-N6)-dimethyltransferase
MKQHTKTLGQVFLHDLNIIKKIVNFAHPHSQTPIIEIGCGNGILTQALASISPVNVIEIDPRWLNKVKALGMPNVTFTQNDALNVDYTQFQKGSPIIANIPYQITTPLIEHLSKYKSHLGPITIMIQADVADRLRATTGSKRYGAMSIFCQYHFIIKKGFFVSRQCFYPKPNVDSYVLTLVPKASVLLPKDERLFFAMTRTFFWGRRKTMSTCLKSSPYLSILRPISPDTNTILRQRGESLSLTDLLALFRKISPDIHHKDSSPWHD